MKNKKLLSLFICVIMILSLVACSSQEKEDVTTPSEEGTLEDETSEDETSEDDLITDDSVIEFQDEELERLIRDNLESPGEEILIGDLKEIKNLHFSGDDYDIKDIEELQYVVNLEEFRATNINIKSLDPLSNLEELHYLDFRDSQVEEEPSKFNTPNLDWLDVSSSNLSDLSFLEDAPLKYVSFHDTGLESLEFARNMDSLMAIEGHNNMVSDLSPLENKPNLDTVGFENNKITDISVLATLPALESLILSDNSDLVDVDVLLEIPSLIYLKIWGFQGDESIMLELENNGVDVMY